MNTAKLESHLVALELRHTTLDKQISEGHTNYLGDRNLSKMKHEKAHVKRMIEDTKLKLKELA